MSEAFWIAIIVGFGGPMLLAILTNWNNSRIRAEERAERAAIAKKAEDAAHALSENMKLVERNTNSMTTTIKRLAEEKGLVEGERKGVAAGEATAKVLAEGQRQGAENARASAEQAKTNTGAALGLGAVPVPVPDAEVPTKDKRVAAATERSADAQERVAKVAEEKKP